MNRRQRRRRRRHHLVGKVWRRVRGLLRDDLSGSIVTEEIARCVTLYKKILTAKMEFYK